MSGIFGWFGLAVDDRVSQQIIEKMARQLTKYDDSQPQLVFGKNSVLAGTAALLDHHPVVFEDENIRAVVSGELRWSDTALAQLAKSEGNAKAFARGYQQRGPDILKSLFGTFAIALVCEKKEEVFLAVDRMGICPLFYMLIEDCFIFGSTGRAINLHPKVKLEIDAQSIFNYMYFEIIPAPLTAYKNQNSLLPGTYALFSKGKLQVETYWKMKYDELEKFKFSDLKQEFRSLLRKSVKEAAQGEEIGAFLSGGTDSSTVAGFLTELNGVRAKTYSIGFEAKGYDEINYARMAARHFNTDHHEYYVTPRDVLDAAPRIAAIYDKPFGNASAVAVYYCAHMARKDGIKKMLGGDGGDELFGGNQRYATQYLFSLYYKLPESLRKKALEPLLIKTPLGNPLSPFYKLRRYIEQSLIPMPERTQTYNLLTRFGAENVFNKDFLRGISIEQPLAQLSEVYSQALAKTMLNRELAMDLKFTLADNDLPKVNRMCELAGIQAAFPFLNDELVAFSGKLPTQLKLKGTKLRFFFKEALQDFLPAEILKKKKHGFGLPFGYWLRSYKPLQNLAYDCLASLKKRGIFQTVFIDELIKKHLNDHATYYGTMIWSLVMLELWYQSHHDSYRV